MQDAKVLVALNRDSLRFDNRGGGGMEVMLIGFGTAVWCLLYNQLRQA